MLDRERILAKLDTLDGYLRELRQVLSSTFAGYQTIATKRACERLLQISVEAVIDVCSHIVADLRLGLPAEEDDLFAKVEQAGVITAAMRETLRKMKGLRNILVHAYGRVDDEIVYHVLTNDLGDFEDFKAQILKALKARTEPHIS